MSSARGGEKNAKLALHILEFVTKFRFGFFTYVLLRKFRPSYAPRSFAECLGSRLVYTCVGAMVEPTLHRRSRAPSAQMDNKKSSAADICPFRKVEEQQVRFILVLLCSRFFVFRFGMKCRGALLFAEMGHRSGRRTGPESNTFDASTRNQIALQPATSSSAAMQETKARARLDRTTHAQP